jgi:hypothetical protein
MPTRHAPWLCCFVLAVAAGTAPAGGDQGPIYAVWEVNANDFTPGIERVAWPCDDQPPGGFDPLTPEGVLVRALCPWWNEFPLLVSASGPCSRAAGDVRPDSSLLAGLGDPFPAVDAWSALGFQTDDRHRRKTGRKAEGEWGQASTSVVLFDAADEDRVPAYRRAWSTEESLKVSLAQPVYVYGQVGATSDAADAQAVQFTGKTGIGLRWEPLPKSELQLRTATEVSYGDPNAPLARYAAPATSQLALELLAKAPLMGPLRMEYTGTALPARTLTERDQLKQDLRVAMPLGEAGQVHVGARYRWDGPLTPTPWIDRAELYMGLSLKR